MAPQQYTSQVIRTTRHDEKTVTQHFSKPEGFTWKAGQFIVIQVVIDGKPTRRSYSISSAAHEETIDITVREQSQGLVSPYLCGLEQGDTITLLGPYGFFVLPEQQAPLLLLGAGTGMSPFRSFLMDLAQTEHTQPITLLQTSKTEKHLLFVEEIAALDTLPITHVCTLTQQENEGWSGRTGRIDAKWIAQYLVEDMHVFICGSTRMVQAMQEHLSTLGLEKKYIHTEKFGNIES